MLLIYVDYILNSHSMGDKDTDHLFCHQRTTLKQGFQMKLTVSRVLIQQIKVGYRLFMPEVWYVISYVSVKLTLLSSDIVKLKYN